MLSSNTFTLLFNAPLLVSAVAVLGQASADDGMWHPSTAQQAGPTAAWANAATAAVASWAAVSPAVVTPAVVASPLPTQVASAAAAGGDWQMSVTWPAGCDKWANPCPAGAHMSGGGVAGGAAAAAATGAGAALSSQSYQNPFTSYTTMTNSDGVITGMPAKATVAAGVNGTALTTMTTTTATRSSSRTPVTSTFSPSAITSAKASSFAVNSNSAATAAPMGFGKVAVAFLAAAVMAIVL